jgi:peptidoglycan/LPS O-acetylase OafA/YrhL
MASASANVSNSVREPARLLRSHMPELDSIRGIAILSVLFYHGFAWSVVASAFTGWRRWAIAATTPGWLGVNLFFVLSGFLISGILLDTRTKPNYYRRFYVRRALRILPLYYLVLGTLLVTHTGSTAFVALSCIYLANMTWMFGVPADYGVLWSLAVEEHFYLVWPAVVRRLSPKRVAALAVTLVIVSPVVRYVLAEFGILSKGLTWGEIDGLACGALLAALLRMRPWSRRQFAWLCTILVASGFAMAIISAACGWMTRRSIGGIALQETPFNIAFAGFLGYALLLSISAFSRCAQPTVLKFFGDTSYCLYLIHLLVFTLYDRVWAQYFATNYKASFGLLCLRFTAVLVCASVLAAISKRWFEDPFLRLKSKLASMTEPHHAHAITPAANGGLAKFPKSCDFDA